MTMPTKGATTGATILQGGRAKAYRPLPLEARATAVHEGLAAYARGDFFEAHELLEPAWMGTADVPERELIQGLIKLAAAYVHGTRGNALGVQKNLRGARDRLTEAGNGAPSLKELADIDVEGLIGAIDERLAAGPRITDAPPPVIGHR
jgi:predicted metal-dependent hydrolase